MTFHMWSIGHYIFIISPFVLTIIFHVLFKHKSYHTKQNIGIALSIFAIIVLFLRNYEIFKNQGYAFDHEILPLQVCHFANFVLLYAFVTDSKPFFGIAALLNIPAAMLSIIFANGLENYATILNFRGGAYIIGHVMIVFIALWAYLNGFVKLDKKVLTKTLGIVFVLFILGIIVNNIIMVTTGRASNYFYATRPQNGTPLETFFNWGKEYDIGNYFVINPIYVMMLTLVGALMITAMYGLLRAFMPQPIKPKESSKQANYRTYLKE